MQPGIPYKRYACRCSKAKILKITSSDGQQNFSETNAFFDQNFIYRVGQMAYPSGFDEDILQPVSILFHYIEEFNTPVLLESGVVTPPINFTAKVQSTQRIQQRLSYQRYFSILSARFALSAVLFLINRRVRKERKGFGKGSHTNTIPHEPLRTSRPPRFYF